MPYKKEGFRGQTAIVLPKAVQSEMVNNILTKLLFVTDIGYYPEARYHFRERKHGCDQNILIYCVKGKGWVECQGGRKTLDEDQFFIIPAQVPHSYGADKASPWTIYWIHFKGEIAGRFVDDILKIRDLETNESSRNRERITAMFKEIYENLSMGYSIENLEYSSICLWRLLGSFKYTAQFQRTNEAKRHDIVEKGILYMNDHIQEKIRLEELASSCGLSVSHYSKVFKSKTLHSPMAYFNDLKIQKACQLLDFSDMQVKEISAQLGFDDVFYFSRLFNQTMGQSPTLYRKKKKG